MTRFLCLCAAMLTLMGCAHHATTPTTEPATQNSLSLTLRDRVALPTSTIDQHGKEFHVTGISGVTWLGDGRFLAVMDNSDKLVRLSIHFDDEGRIESVNVTGGVTLARKRDNEGIALDPTDPGSVWVSDEGKHTPPPAAKPEEFPQVTRYSLADGRLLDTLTIPPELASRRSNFGLESLAITADGRTLWTANEQALTIDGPMSDNTRGTTVRLFRYDRDGSTFRPTRQFFYLTDPAHAGGPQNQQCGNGLSDLIALNDGRLITLERSYGFIGPVPSLETRIFLVDFDDTSATPAHKHLLWTGPAQNLEGLCLGPRLPDGRRVVVGGTDNNDKVENLLFVFVLDGLRE
ncbi:MAG: esterase-like activity of phytase family protein [Planctomycetes bacterium]|nr:esterase-like activity of phytase family protein [Planctomycetota bacterium]